MTGKERHTGAKASAAVADILGILDEIAPFDLAEEWDNCGLLVGDPKADVSRVLVALDPSLPVLEEAAQKRASLVVTHHPLFLEPLASIRADSIRGRAIHLLIKESISHVALHTNFDLATGGVADLLMERLGFGEGELLIPDPRNLTHRGNAVGMGRVADISPPAALSELIQRVAGSLGLDGLRAAGSEDMAVARVAVVPGSGAGLIGPAKAAGCEAIITGDVKYHQARDAQELGIAVIDIGHFASEAVALEGLKKAIEEGAARAGLEIEVILCTSEEEPLAFAGGLL
jgi:dinuclear metal center YbgI/SA1388 family protein